MLQHPAVKITTYHWSIRSDLCQIGAEIAELVDVLGGVENIYQFGQRIL